jgi:outer membrane protein assembly factor BamA
LSALGAVFVCLFAGQAEAQIPESCLPFPTLASEIAAMRAEAPKRIVTVHSLTLHGAHNLPRETQRELIVRMKQHVFDADEPWLDKLQDEIRGDYQDLGYLLARVEATFKVLHRENLRASVAVNARVDEGVQYRLKGIRIASDDPQKLLSYSSEELRKLIPLRDGEIARADQLRAGLEAWNRHYGSGGYIDMVVEPNFEPENAGSEMLLLLYISEGKQYRVGAIEFRGLTPELRETLRRNLRLSHGDVFDNRLYEEFFVENRALLPVGAGRHNVDIKRDPATQTLNVVFDFRTCKDFWPKP